MKKETVLNIEKNEFKMENKDNSIRIKDCNKAKKLFGRVFSSKSKNESLDKIRALLDLKAGINIISKEQLITFVDNIKEE